MKRITISLAILLLSSTSCRIETQETNRNTATNENKVNKIFMKQKDFTTTILVDKTPKEAFDAINNVRGWWSEEIEGNTNQLNDVFTYHYEDVHRCQMKITELVPNEKVAWLVMDNYFNFTKDKSEWKNTIISFEISSEGNKTKIRFTHIGLVPEYECYAICEGAWSTYINDSLYKLITTGKGHPNGKDKPRTEHEKILSLGNKKKK